ncbi:DNA alkylation repair enzyme [Gimesia aquarii]|uniref:DNA alkylation repair enzyme n=2 Tax=Gimesia aquarii TaxID=2527964 RepID=A0A517WXP5_9PLAN|nr:DNA alkylation repair enzyme [Gimesia aquarii]
MIEPFKNMFNKKMIAAMGIHFQRAWPDFDCAGFTKMSTKGLKNLELKERSSQITEALCTFLPRDFDKAASVILGSLADEYGGDVDVTVNTESGISGWGVMPMVEYVGLQGLEHFDLSMSLFKEMTKRFTSEFGIRHFLLAEPRRTLSVLKKWAKDSNYHVRRLVSEGTRPRLPWAMQLPGFIDDPTPILALLEILKDDKEEYVRRSVANNLNDIAKDHPDLVAEIAKRWMKDAEKNREKLVRHACRTLIKQGHKKTLKVLGYGTLRAELETLDILTPSVNFGNELKFEISLRSTSTRPQNFIIDYAIHHQKANGTTTPKIFKCKTGILKPSSTLKVSRKHPLKKITTRVYYPGTHRVEIFVNGSSFGAKDFELIMP